MEGGEEEDISEDQKIEFIMQQYNECQADLQDKEDQIEDLNLQLAQQQQEAQENMEKMEQRNQHLEALVDSMENKMADKDSEMITIKDKCQDLKAELN